MSKSERTKSNLSDILLLYTTKQTEPHVSFTYEVECTTFKAVKITLDFEGSENFAVVDQKQSTMKLTATLRPFHRTELGTVRVVSDDRRASLKMGCSWIMSDPSETEVAEHVRNHQLQMAPLLKEASSLPFPPIVEDPDLKALEEVCRNYGKNYIDKDFLPTAGSLFRPSLSSPSPGSSRSSAIEWRRAADFMYGPYDVFINAVEPADIRQGALGDCWFLCAVASLAEFPQLILDVVVTPKKHPFGCYCLKFCKNGWWQVVRVDDFFPCYPSGGPIYSKSHGNELWVLLLEKAYSKLHGSYEAIKSGWAYEAMMDMTGAPCITIRFDDSSVKKKISSGELWRQLRRYDEENFCLSASTPGEDVYTETGKKPGKNGNGLVAGHAYSLIAVRETSKGDKLVKLRNPWGSMEWNGDWSDSSPLWTEQMLQEIERVVKSDDGTFWMSFQDMLTNFYSINVCMTRHPKYSQQPWIESRRKFYIDYDADDFPIATAAVTDDDDRVSVPIFALTVSQPGGGHFIAAVHQEDIRCQGAKPYIDIGVSVLKVDPTYGTFSLVTGSGTSVERQNQTDQFHLPAGKYLVVPTTTGIKLKQQCIQEGSTTATNMEGQQQQQRPHPKQLVIRDIQEGGQAVRFTEEAEEVFSELFDRMDHDGDGLLNKVELDQFMVRSEGAPIQDKAYQWLLDHFEPPEAKGLSKRGFIRAQLFVFERVGADEESLFREFRSLGYNDQLELSHGRSAVLSVHGSVAFSLDVLPFDPAVFEEAVELPIVQHGEVTQYEGGKVCLYRHRGGYGGVSFVVANNHPSQPLLFVMDCSGSKNVVSHRPSLRHEEMVPAGGDAVMHHLAPADVSAGSWSWSYKASYMFSPP